MLLPTPPFSLFQSVWLIVMSVLTVLGVPSQRVDLPLQGNAAQATMTLGHTNLWMGLANLALVRKLIDVILNYTLRCSV